MTMDIDMLRNRLEFLSQEAKVPFYKVVKAYDSLPRDKQKHLFQLCGKIRNERKISFRNRIIESLKKETFEDPLTESEWSWMYYYY